MASRSAYAPDYLTPLGFGGDSLQRSIAKLPTLFNLADVQQGATHADVALSLSQNNDVFNNVASSGTTMTRTVEDTTGTVVDNVVNTASAPDTVGGDCSNVSWTNPLALVTCLLNRSLFGLLAVAFIVMGIYIFTKD